MPCSSSNYWALILSLANKIEFGDFLLLRLVSIYWALLAEHIISTTLLTFVSALLVFVSIVVIVRLTV